MIPAWGERYVSYLPNLVQTLRDEGIKEIVVVTQGDETPEGLAAKIVEAPEGSSVGAARNRGLAEIQSELVLFADADDLPVRGVLDRLSIRMISEPDLLALAGRRVYMKGGLYPWPSNADCRPRSQTRRALRQFFWNHIPMNSGTLIRTERLRELGGWPDAYLNSDDSLACLLVRSGLVELLDLPSAYYRESVDSLFHSEENTLRRWLSAYRQQRRWLSSHPMLSRRHRFMYRFQLIPHLYSAIEMRRRAKL